MDGGLHFAEAAEDGGGVFLHAIGQRGGVDHPEDRPEMAVFLSFLDLDVKLGGGDTGALDFLKRQRRACAERVQGVDNLAGVGAGIGQRAHQHVATDSGESVQVAQLAGH